MRRAASRWHPGTVLPWSMIVLRMLLALLLIGNAFSGHQAQWVVHAYGAGFLSDILDGHFTRVYHSGTPTLARWDSQADIALQVAALTCAFRFYPAGMRPLIPAILVFISIQLIGWGWSILKFKRSTSYHTYSAKAWGVLLAAGFLILFSFRQPGPWLGGIVLLGIIYVVEEIAITTMLDTPHTSVRSILQLVRQRKN